jgi:hypothetical protein
MGKVKMRTKLLSKKLEKVTTLRTRHRWDDNIGMDLKEEGSVDWMHLAEEGDQWRTLVKKVMNPRV